MVADVQDRVGKDPVVARLERLVAGGGFVAEAFLLKALTRNDDSGRHGVLIPHEAYPLFPPLGGEVAAGEKNPKKPILTVWRQRGGWQAQSSRFIHYDRYPERRITSLQPDEVNRTGERLALIAKARGEFVYRCMVVVAGEEGWDVIHAALSENAPVALGSFRILAVGARTDSPVYGELLEKLRAISARGWVRTVRAGDTGVGMTLESLLGIAANARTTPDYSGIELKAKRVGKSGGRRTLFAKTPEWGPGGRVALLDEHGHPDPNGRWSIYQSIYAHRESSDGWRLEYDSAGERLWVLRRGARVVSWTRASLAKSLETKHQESVFVYARSRGKGADEEFHFVTALHATGASVDRFLQVLADGDGCQDFAIHRKEDGSVRDHGFLFRVDDAALASVFEDVQSVDLDA